VVTGDTRFSAPWESSYTIAGGTAVSRPNIIRSFNWNCNKRLKLYPVAVGTTVNTAAAAYKYAPVNDPRTLIPFATIMCTNREDHSEAPNQMPTVQFDACSYFNDA
jgi:hypothetical protein